MIISLSQPPRAANNKNPHFPPQVKQFSSSHVVHTHGSKSFPRNVLALPAYFVAFCWLLRRKRRSARGCGGRSRAGGRPRGRARPAAAAPQPPPRSRPAQGLRAAAPPARPGTGSADLGNWKMSRKRCCCRPGSRRSERGPGTASHCSFLNSRDHVPSATHKSYIIFSI